MGMTPEDLSSVTIHAKGTATGEFTSVKYSAAVHASGKTGREAKDRAKPTIEKIKSAIAANAERAGLESDRLKTKFSVGKEVRYNSKTGANERVGYVANYSVEFRGRNVAEATSFHDELTSIEGAEVESPQFGVEDMQELDRAAFEDAVGKAKDRFAQQCAILEYDPSLFRVATWSVTEETGHRGKVVAAERPADGRPISLSPGKTEHVINLQMVFVRK